MWIRNAVLILPDSILTDASVRVHNTRIVAAGRAVEDTAGEESIDAHGWYLAPGFIDLHIHIGYLAPNCTLAEELELCARALPGNGTTGYVPTLVSALQGLLPAQFEIIRKYMAAPIAGARPLAVHLEAPYVAPGAIGGFSPEQITTPDRFSMDEILNDGADLIKIVMVAPELPGAFDVIGNLAARGIVPAMGHTLADEKVYEEARRAGACHCTHTYNNRRTFPESRAGGRGITLDDLAVADDDVTCELIADGVHVKPAWMKTLYRTKGPRKIALITDSFLCGQRGEEGRTYQLLGGKRITIEHGVGRNDDGGLSGSVLTQDRALRNFMNLAGASLVDAVCAVTLNPARIIGMDSELGSIEPGKRANLVLLDAELRPRLTLVDGEVCWRA